MLLRRLSFDTWIRLLYRPMLIGVQPIAIKPSENRKQVSVLIQRHPEILTEVIILATDGLRRASFSDKTTKLNTNW